VPAVQPREPQPRTWRPEAVGAVIVLVAGPPCSGKSTYVEQHAQPGDFVVDWDLIAQELGSTATHNHPRTMRDQINYHLLDRCQQVADGLHPRSWVIRCLADPAKRARWVGWLSAELVIIDEPDEVLEERALQRPDPAATLKGIRYWRRLNSREARWVL
jgi:hypothetical protein